MTTARLSIIEAAIVKVLSGSSHLVTADQLHGLVRAQVVADGQPYAHARELAVSTVRGCANRLVREHRIAKPVGYAPDRFCATPCYFAQRKAPDSDEWEVHNWSGDQRVRTVGVQLNEHEATAVVEALRALEVRKP